MIEIGAEKMAGYITWRIQTDCHQSQQHCFVARIARVCLLGLLCLSTAGLFLPGVSTWSNSIAYGQSSAPSNSLPNAAAPLNKAPAKSAAPASQNQSEQTVAVVRAIRFVGLQRVTSSQIRTNLLTRIGGLLRSDWITEDIHSIHATGYFERVFVEAIPAGNNQYTVVFNMEELPQINSIDTKGNRELEKKKILELLKISSDQFYDQQRMEVALDVIRAEYRKKGFFQSLISVDVEKLAATNTVNLTIQVEEKRHLYLTNIRFEGNTLFHAKELERMLTSAEVDCFSWANQSGIYDYNRINFDLQSVSSRYLARGYIRLSIARPKVQIIHGRDFSKVKVDIQLAEGSQYFMGQIEIDGDLIMDKDQIRDIFSLQTGDVFNQLVYQRDILRLREVYTDRGYAFAQVLPRKQIDDEKKVVNVSIQIVKGEKVYIGAINFAGNKSTRDYVLRRELSIHEGELYSSTKIRRSQEALTRLGYFKAGLEIKKQPNEQVSNVLNLRTDLEEGQTGSLQMHVGYGAVTGLNTGITISKANLFGKGQTAKGELQWSQKGVSQLGSVTFIEPYFFDSQFRSESSLSYRVREDSIELEEGSIKEITISQGFSRHVFGRWSAGGTLSTVSQNYVAPDQEDRRLNKLSSNLSYNTVDHPLFPTRGTAFSIAAIQVGGRLLGGSTEFREYRLSLRQFYFVFPKAGWVVMTQARLGWLEQVNQNVIPLEERYRLGGISSVRGYSSGEIGGAYGNRQRKLNGEEVLEIDDRGRPVLDSGGTPAYAQEDVRTKTLNQKALDQLKSGGVQERVFNAELLMPLTGNNLRAVVFYDAGQVNSEDKMYKLLGSKKPSFFDLEQSVGAGFRFITPLGVLRFEYGVKLSPDKKEKTDEFEFNISSLF